MLQIKDIKVLPGPGSSKLPMVMLANSSNGNPWVILQGSAAQRKRKERSNLGQTFYECWNGHAVSERAYEKTSGTVIEI
jgi:hypothetical protein